jgi:hypothetical protein
MVWTEGELVELVELEPQAVATSATMPIRITANRWNDVCLMLSSLWQLNFRVW